MIGNPLHLDKGESGLGGHHSLVTPIDWKLTYFRIDSS